MSRILVIGMGHAGKRHAANLTALGHEPLCYDPKTRDSDVPSVEAGLLFKPEAAVIATPPDRRMTAIAQCAAAGIPMLVEKPLAATLADATEIVELIETR